MEVRRFMKETDRVKSVALMAAQGFERMEDNGSL
jgi:hypothetical protein